MPLAKKQKLILLSKHIDLQSGKVDEDSFKWVNSLFDRAIKKASLDKKIAKCNKCSGMNISGITSSAPGFGNLKANIFFIGQSLCTVCQFTKMPFTKGSGYLIDAALMLSGLTRYDVFITNVVHCHPTKNRTSTKDEKDNCFPFLQREVNIVNPKLIITLGSDAKIAAEKLITKAKIHDVKHPAAFMYADPQSRVRWVISLSNIIDKYIGDKS